MYKALSNPPDPLVGTEPDDNIYDDDVILIDGKIKVDSGIKGENATYIGEEIVYRKSRIVEIAYTKSERFSKDEKALVVFLHGVPTNRRQWLPIQKRLSKFVDTFAFDMLGMGESEKVFREDLSTWEWKNDLNYIEEMLTEFYLDRKFVFVADDWGAGIALKYAERWPERLHSLILLDPIAFDGYPVSEIQAIGRLSSVTDKAEQMSILTAAFDQTLVQIYKTMVHCPAKFNQYSLRTLKGTYVDTDYERPGANSMTLKLNQVAIAVLAERASILSPDLLLPYSRKENPKGVAYDKITVPVLVMWGMQDNMMPEAQRHRFQWVMNNTSVQLIRIPDAGHYAGIDQPEFVAESILNFIIEKHGRTSVYDIFLGFKDKWTIWKGDEKHVRDSLKKIYKL